MTVQRTIDHVVGVGTTVGTGSVDLITYSPPNSTAGGVFMTGTGKSDDAVPSICKRAIMASWKKSNAGALTMMNVDVVQQTTDLALLATNLTVLASGGNIVVRATGGLIGTDLEWGADMWISIC